MVFIWILVVIAVLALDVLSIVDAVGRKHSVASLAGWILLILVLPFLGAIIYWATRRSTSPADVEAAHLAEADLRRTPQR
jgi:hypothetical protein